MSQRAALTSPHELADRISGQEAFTLSRMFRCRVALTPDAIAYEQYDPIAAAWNRYSWAHMLGWTARWQVALEREGLRPGERVAILLQNCAEWVCFDQAALASGLVVVPLYASDSAENIAYILGDSGAKFLLVGAPEDWRPLAALDVSFSSLERIVHVRGTVVSGTDDARLRSLADWLPATAGRLEDRSEDPHALATCVYTSGTTGPPKGVMLSHNNILFASSAVLDVVPGSPDDVFLSFLPLAHIFERAVGYYLPMIAGSKVAFARSIESLPEDFIQVSPTILLAVPRIYERLYIALHGIAEESCLARRLIKCARAVGWLRFEATQGRASPPGILHWAAWSVLERLVARRMLSRLGGRVRVAASGGAALSAEVARFLVALGLPLVEGYGLTETAAPVCLNRLEDNIPGTVGRPLPGVEVALGADKELLVRSPGVMLGYWAQPEATRAAIDEDGWLHTGDCAEIDEGRITIVGRLKEILVTSTGESIAPSGLEAALEMDPLIDQAAVVGDGMPYLSAILVLDRDGWNNFAASLGVDPDAELSLESSTVIKGMTTRLQGRLRAFPRYAQIHAVHLVLEPWTVENGLLTITMKLRRHRVEASFARAIEAIYRDVVPAPILGWPKRPKGW